MMDKEVVARLALQGRTLARAGSGWVGRAAARCRAWDFRSVHGMAGARARAAAAWESFRPRLTAGRSAAIRAWNTGRAAGIRGWVMGRARAAKLWARTARVRRFLFSRIALQFQLAACLLLVLVLGLIGTMLVRDQRQMLLEEMQAKCDLFVKSLSIVVREAYYPKPDLFFLGYLSQETMKEDWIRRITLSDQGGRVILSREQAAVAPAGHLSFVRPILLRGKQVGAVEMVFSTEPLQQAARRVTRRIVLIALGSILVGIFLIAAAVPFLVRPILELARASGEVGKGNFEVEVRYRSRNEIGMLTSTFNHMVRGLKEREFIRAAFGQYFSPQVAQAILGGKIALGGEKKEVTVLFADIRDFTAFSESMPPEQVVSFLNGFFARMVQVIHGHRGTVDKFIGDAVLAVFGSPIPFAEHAEEAVRCAQGMREALKAFNAEREARGEPPVRIGISLNSGEVLAGNIGTSEKTEYTVIGDAVNLASRMEGLNKRFGTDVLVSRTTVERAKDLFRFKSLGVQVIRGRQEPAEVFELLGPDA